MLPYQIIEGGRFTSDATLMANIRLSVQPDFFWLRNRTEWGSGNAETAVESWWRTGMTAGAAQFSTQIVATNALTSGVATASGFTFVDTSNPPLYTALAGTAVTAANPAVVSMANTGSITVGDVVRLYAVTGMQQIATYDFTVTAVTTNVSITLGYLNAAGFAAAATAAQVLKFIPNRMYPRWRYITSITQAAQAVVTFSVAHNFTAGENVSFRVSSAFGMDEMNNVVGRVLSVTASTVTLDVDSSGFTAFAFPTSAAALLGVSPAVAVPSSSGIIPLAGSATVPQDPPGTNLLDAFDNRNQYFMSCGSSVITSASNVYDWMSCKFDAYSAL